MNRQRLARQAQWDQRRERLGGALWVLPASMVVVALIAGSVLSRIRVHPDSLLGPVLFKGDHDEARRLLLTVATSIVGILALVIGLSMVAIQMATNRYSPRLLRNFLRDRPVQFVLGVFVGAFTYNAAGLYTVGIEQNEYPRLAVTAGLASLFVSIGALIFYLDHMVHSIQIDTVLARIGTTTAKTIALEPPGIGGSAGDAADLADDLPPGAAPLRARHSGYVQIIRPNRLLAIAVEQNVTIRTVLPVGAHTVAGAVLAWVWPNSLENLPHVDSLEAALEDGVQIGFERTMRQDVAVGLEQIVDIALLSMHNFDFHTSVQSTNELAILLNKLNTKALGPEAFSCRDGIERVVVTGRRFEDFVEIAVGQIRRRGANEPVVLSALLGMLRDLGSMVASEDRRACIAAQIATLAETATRSIPDAADVARVQTEAQTALRQIAC
ncbi:DUF2254 domain-containing protein [Antrihabitans sp. YC2-6]|uniref:DUF2254 domain-containing protein n=1 Tax=Antrihabitans sp. YC2-6 TaxID=2799498 RepID=UPI0018F576B5|nr:DUF2254 domain-containing protein [Antrihabitans sp. YC2-6]MBJ8348418.1 DUF2254 domain-containing protein [Antrihabitans sp. YC2-6]